MTLQLVSDNSNRTWDSALEEYTDNPNPDTFPYMLNNDEGEVMEMFKTFGDAIQYQMGMGLRATTTIELWEE